MGCHLSPNVGSFVAWSVHSKKSGITKGVEQGNIKAQYQVYINPLHFPVTFVSPESHTHHSVSLLSLFIHFQTENAASTTFGPIWSCILLLEFCHFSWSARCMSQGMFCAWKLHVYQGNVLWLKTASTFWSVISLSARLLLFPSCECRTLPKLDRQQKAVVSSYPFKPVTVFDFPCSCSIVWCVFSLDFPRLQGGPANVKLHYDPDSIDGKHLGLNFTASFSCAGRILCHYFHSILSIACTCLSL